MSYYLKDGNNLWPTRPESYDVKDSLPLGTYNVGHDTMRGWYLKPIDDFNVSGKIYGKTNQHADRILNTFDSRPNATGVLLNGEKGSGKTLLAKLISQEGAKRGISTLVINTPFSGDGFNTFVQGIDEPCIIVFDEFEKVFDEDDQEKILTLLDGVFPTKKLFILTVNDKFRVNQHMRNRPGRIFYMLDFKGLDNKFIEEYCIDNLKNKTYIQQICRITSLFDSFNFDMLKALVEEMNRYDESPQQSLEMLNIKSYDAGSALYNVEAFIGDKKLEKDYIHPNSIRGIPIAHELLEFNINLPNKDENEDGEWVEFEITQHMLKNIDYNSGVFTYTTKNDRLGSVVLNIVKNEPKSFSYDMYSGF